MTEPRNRATLGFTAVLASLDERLENEGEVLDAFLLAMSRGQLTPEAWPKLHVAAQRDDRLAELAFAYEQVAADRRLRTLQAAAVAEFMFQAAVFFGDVFGDDLGSGSYLDRALAAVPTHAGSLERRESLLAAAGDHAGIGEMYADLAAHRPRGEQAPLFRKAAAAFARAGAQDRVADVLQALLRVDPKDEEARAQLEEALLGAHRPRDVVKLLEQSLAADPPPPDDVAHAQRQKVLAAYRELNELERTLPHLEAILARDPSDAPARETALALLEQRSTAGRAAGALAQAAEALGAHAETARFYALELEHVRGPRKAAVLKALAALREDHLADPEGAYEAAEAALGLDPSDGPLLDRFVNLTRVLARHDASTKTLSRLLGLTRDAATKARLSTATGELLLANGDVKRARAAFSSALTVPGAGDEATLGAARALARIYAEDEDHASLAEMLERVVRSEPVPEKRLEAAEQLAALASGALGDPARAIVAWQALLDSPPARMRALQALEPLLSGIGDAVGLADVLRARANASTDPTEQRALLFRAAEALTEASGNLRSASAAWRELIDRFGPTRDVLARWLPLLQLEREWTTLDQALMMDASLAEPAERAGLYGSLGVLRIQKLHDAEGSLAAFRAALADDPQERASRAALEQMLEGEDDSLAFDAATILEPLVRAEGARQGLFRVLYTRATRTPVIADRLQAALEALVAAEQLPGERARAIDLADRALMDASATGAPLAPWIDAIEKLTPGEDGAARRVRTFAHALADHAVDSHDRLALARATGDAAMVAGDGALALDVFRRALEFAPDSPDLMASVELLLREQGTPQDRLRLYQSALGREAVPEKRRALFTAVAEVQRSELGDLAGALATLTEALVEDPDNQPAAEALFEVHVQTGAWLEACRLLEDRLSRTPPGQDERALHSRIAALAAAHGLPDRALEHARALLDDALATATDLDLVEQVADQLVDKPLACDVAARRAEVAESAEERLLLLSRLGAMQLDRSEPAAAVAAWHEGAVLAEQLGDRKNARKLYERIRKTAPYDRTATTCLAAIVEAAGETALLPELYASLVEAAASVDERREALLRLSHAVEQSGDFSGAFDAALRAFTESPGDAHLVAEATRLAKASGGRAAFLRAADPILAEGLAPAERIRVVAARAELLADDPERAAEATDALRDVARDPEASAELREQVLCRLEAILGEHPDRAPADTWRWLFEQRAASAGGREKSQVLLRWGRAEEQRFGDEDRALALYRLAAEVDPTSSGSMEVARLTLARGDVEGALASLRLQLAAADASVARRLRTDIAAILLSQGGRAPEALAELRQALEAAPDDGAALKLVAGLLADKDAGADASALLENAVEAAADDGVRSRALRALLDGATDAPAERRTGWHQRAIEAAEALGTEEAYLALLAALSEFPTEVPWWDRSEQLARKLDRPTELGELYRRILAGPMDAETTNDVGQRAVAFHEEWFEDPSGVVRILERLVDLDPSGWAFDRLKLLFDAQERWDELFHLYDRVLAADIDDGRKVELLEDAAQIAKDFAKNADRAISYLEQLLNRKPKNERLIASLERLYERHGRNRELVSLLEAQLGGKPVERAQELRGRIARIWLDDLGDAASALLVVEEMLGAGDEGETTTVLLERILGAAPVAEEVRRTLPPTSSPVSDSIAAAYESIAPPRASVPPPRASVPPRGSVAPPAKGRGKRVLVRQRTAGLLRERYAATGKDPDLARVLEVELENVKNAKDRIRRHREIAALYERLGNDAAALEHSVSLVMLEPESEAHRSQLVSLAERASRWDRLAEVLAAAADDCEGDELRVTLLMDAGLVHADRLSDGARAIELLGRVLAFEVDHAVLLRAARRLEALLGLAAREHERLGVLERIALLEPDAAARKIVLGEAARVAAMLGETDHGVAAWEARLTEDDQDLEAATGLVTLLETAERHRPLYEALERRARLLADPAERRADRVRAARLLSDELHDPVAAIGAWEALTKDFGDAEDSTSALAALYAQEQLWDRQAALLTRAAERATVPERRAELLLTLGDLQREHLDAPDDAVLSYEAALVAAPGDPRTLAGLRVLLSDARSAAVAIDVLLASQRAADAWASVLELTADRLRVAKDDPVRIAVLLEVAELHERRAGDAGAAFESVRDAFVLSRGDVRIEGELARLAELAGAWRAYADAHRQVLDVVEADDVAADPGTLARLRLDLADALENRLDDPRGALALLLRVAELAPEDEVAGTSAVRVASRIQRWDAAARVILDRATAAKAVDEGLLTTLESNVVAPGGWDAATSALEAALAQRTELEPSVARDLEARIASWHRDRRGDADAAEVAFGRALAHDPVNAELLRAIAHLQRRNRGRPLIDSLLRLSQATGGDPELLREAAEVASSVVVDRGLAKSILERLLKLSAERWTGASDEAPMTLGSPSHPSEYVEWALGELVRIHNEEGNAERIVSLLAETAKLPFELQRGRALRHEAARVAQERLEDYETALTLYGALFDDDEDDAVAAERLAWVLGALDRKADLLSLRKRQIARATERSVRIPLRLDVARIERELGHLDDAVLALRENLREEPRHPASTLALSSALEDASRFGDLVTFLAVQAELAERDTDVRAAVELWARAAELAEQRLDDLTAALGYYRRVLPLAVRPGDLDAIARLHERREEWADAAEHLDRLVVEFPDERARIVLRLADDLVRADRETDARTRLEGALDDPRSPDELPGRLAELYRTAELHAPLAELLTRQALRSADPEVKRSGLEEAADLLLTRCGAPDRAAELLLLASELAPDDRTLKLRLAEALSAAGRIDDARELLRGMLEAFGGRRPKERAQVHFHLARLQLKIGDRVHALAELEAAMRIDPANPEILRMVAELARDDGQLEKAERSYRALLSVLRRDTGESPVARSEVLLELADIAERQGEAERSAEILESAFEAATASVAEGVRLETILRAKKQNDALLRALRSRLDRTKVAEKRAEVLLEIANVEQELGRADDALTTRLGAIEAAPAAKAIHEACLAHARSIGATATYVDRVLELGDKLAGEGHAKGAAALLLRVGALLQDELADPKRAAETLERAAKADPSNAEVLRTLDRTYASLDDPRQEGVLERLVALGAEQTARDPRAAGDVQYRLASLRLRRKESRDEGATLLRAAFELAPDVDRALALVLPALEDDGMQPTLVVLLEQLARSKSDPALLVRAIALRARLGTASPELLREGVEAAERLGKDDDAEHILTHAMAVEDPAFAAWAKLELAGICQRRGDLAATAKLKLEAARLLGGDDARRLRIEAAEDARTADPAIARQAYEAILEETPKDTAVQEQLLGLLRDGGRTTELVEALARAIDGREPSAEKTALRLERARLCAGALGEAAGAVEQLRELLDEDPSSDAAATALVDLLEASGDRAELTELLEKRLEAAKDRSDAAGVATLALRLGSLLEKDEPRRARTVLSMGLDWEPANVELLRTSLRLISPEDAADRSEVLDRLLAVETGVEAESLALELAALRLEQWDSEGAERALEAGLRGQAGSAVLRERLMSAYADRGDSAKLAALHELTAPALAETERRAAQLEAARLYGELGDRAAVARVLRAAHLAAPADADVLHAYLDALSQSDDVPAACAELDALAPSLESTIHEGRWLVERARLAVRDDRYDDAVDAAERAYAIDHAYGDTLAEILALSASAATGEPQRALRVRLAGLLGELGRDDDARGQLEQLLSDDPSDTGALSALAVLEERVERWDAAADILQRLVEAQGDSLLAATALRLADACERANVPGYARQGLERAHRLAPSDPTVTVRLAELYGTIGAVRELAILRLEEVELAEPEQRFPLLIAAATLLGEAGDPASAAEALRKALALKPNDLECAGLLADAHIAMGDMASADELLRAALDRQKGRRSKDLAHVYLRLARVARSSGDRKTDVAMLTTALDMDGQNGAVASELARVSRDEGNLDLEIRALRTVTMLRTPAAMPRAEAYERLGEIAIQQGDTKKAVMLLKRALDDDPTRDRARELLASLD